MKKSVLALLLTGSMLAASMTPVLSFAGNRTLQENNIMQDATVLGKEEDTSKEHLAWSSSIQMKIKEEPEILEEMGMTWSEWDEAVSKRKELGIENPLTREKLLNPLNLSDAQNKAVKASVSPKGKEPSQSISPQILEENGYITFIQPGEGYVVRNGLEAYELAYRLLELCGGNHRTCLTLWNQLISSDQVVFSFAQISGSATLLGSVLKIVTDREGNVTAIYNSLNTAKAESEPLATVEEVNETVLKELEKDEEKEEIYPEYTERVHIEETSFKFLRVDNNETGREYLYWITYTSNHQGAKGEGDKPEYPYLAHYLTLDGKYLYSLPVREPGDEASHAGVNVPDLFEGMVTEEYTTTLTKKNGVQTEVRVPVMFSHKTGLWYLGDATARLVIADYAEYTYGEDHELVLLSSETKDGFDSEDLFLLDNYLKAAHFFQDMGWEGPAGVASPVLILRNLCTEDGALYVNACNIGLFRGFQVFGYTPREENGNPSGLVQSLDVLVHEFTHAFTSTMMVTNLYQNDPGAINEAMSDIFGNLGEHILEGNTDPDWLINEASGTPIRNMSRPELYSQPRYVWDSNYGSPVNSPSDANDRGGVHVNSSLLNLIGAKLCLDYHMSYEEAVHFWADVAMCITPGMDYPQMAVLLHQALKVSGNEDYREGLEDLIEKTRLTQTELPKTLPADQRLIHLQFPDTEAFQDKNWTMIIYQLNTNALSDITVAALNSIIAALNTEEFAPQLDLIMNKLAENLQLEKSHVVLTEKAEDDLFSLLEKTFQVSKEALKKLIVISMAWPQEDGKEILSIIKNYPTIYTLSHMTSGETGMDAFYILLKDHWVNLSFDDIKETSAQPEEERKEFLNMLSDFFEAFAGSKEAWTPSEESGTEARKFDLEGFLSSFIEIFNYIKTAENKDGLDEFLNNLYSHPATPVELTNKGLEEIVLPSGMEQTAVKSGEETAEETREEAAEENSEEAAEENNEETQKAA